ncbi:MAG: flavodoxin family protein [Sporomusaceae bacterium]|nr:flavodoxin family protein [Sporomusaceae bacterium]
MKITTILGSPKEKGKTSQALTLLEDKLTALGHEAERIWICRYTISGCSGCYACMASKNEPSCVQRDDAVSLFQRLVNSDAIIYAGPIYFFDFTAQFKAFLDRHYCLTVDFGTPDASSMLAGKKVALLITCMGQEEGNADLAQVIFDRSMNGIMKCNVMGKHVIALSETADFVTRADAVAYKLVQEITTENIEFRERER